MDGNNPIQNPTPIKNTVSQKPATVPEQKPAPKLSDEQAKALLAVNNLGGNESKPKNSKTVWYVVMLVASLAVALIISLFLHTGTNNSSGSGANDIIPNRTNNPLNKGGSINSQVQYCSNPINATLVC